MTATEQIPDFIRTLLTPMFMVTGAASMNWGLQRLQFALMNRLHLLNDERTALQHASEQDVLVEVRLVQIGEQLHWLTRRARHARNAIASFYMSILALLLCSGSIAAVWMWNLEMSWVCTFLFEAGMLFIYVALVYTLLDVWLSYRAVELDTQF
jgi:hypothetical protein